MAELIAFGNTEVASSDFSVVAGTPKSMYIKPQAAKVAADTKFTLQHKDADGNYTDVCLLEAADLLSLGTITGTGTFRLLRHASVFGAGMDIE